MRFGPNPSQQCGGKALGHLAPACLLLTACFLPGVHPRLQRRLQTLLITLPCPPLEISPPCNLPPWGGGGRPSLHSFARQYLLRWFVFPICHTHVLALLSHDFKSVTCVYSVIFSLQRQCTGCRVPFSDPRFFLLVTVYGTTHAHLVHMCWPLLWGLEIPLQSPPPPGGETVARYGGRFQGAGQGSLDINTFSLKWDNWGKWTVASPTGECGELRACGEDYGQMSLRRRNNPHIANFCTTSPLTHYQHLQQHRRRGRFPKHEPTAMRTESAAAPATNSTSMNCLASPTRGMDSTASLHFMACAVHWCGVQREHGRGVRGAGKATCLW